MKKALALVLALCMVFAMGTVAFAVEDGKITKADPDAESFIVKTVVDPEQDYESWEVTIPADIEIPWVIRPHNPQNTLLMRSSKQALAYHYGGRQWQTGRHNSLYPCRRHQCYNWRCGNKSDEGDYSSG